MANSYQLILSGQPADADLYTAIDSLEVEESMDLPGAVQLSIPVVRSSDGDLTYIADSRFMPLANLAVVATPDGSGAAGSVGGVVGAVTSVVGGDSGSAGAQCIFDGYVLSHKIHLERGSTGCTLAVWGQDASWLMNLTEKVKEWVDVTDGEVANAIFGDYGINPADENSSDDSPSHTESGHSLMQRGSDIQFLRSLARRNGKLCRVTCNDQPGQRTGYFAKPKLDGDPALTLVLNDPQAWTVNALDLEWDATRPTSVVARQALFTDNDENGVTADTSDSGLTLLGPRGLSDFASQSMTVMLAAPVDDAGELTLRAESVLRDSDWFIKCEGETDVSRLGAVVRAGMVVAISGVGALHSGSYLVWRVHHTINADAHTMKFLLVRNAIGPNPSSGAGGLAGLVNAL